MTSMTVTDPLPLHVREASRLTRAGLVVLLLGLLPMAAWLAFAPLASAVVAPALVVKVDLNRRPVQHPEGGIVRKVRVRVGQLVAEGEALIVLGDVAVDADMQPWSGRVHAERASLARLEAEQSMARVIAFPRELPEMARSDAALADRYATVAPLRYPRSHSHIRRVLNESYCRL